MNDLWISDQGVCGWLVVVVCARVRVCVLMHVSLTLHEKDPSFPLFVQLRGRMLAHGVCVCACGCVSACVLCVRACGCVCVRGGRVCVFGEEGKVQVLQVSFISFAL